MWFYIVLGVIALMLLVYGSIMLLYKKWFVQLKPFLVPQTHKPTHFFSIIIPARNEEQNIGTCLQSILLQNYPKQLFEIIVIDDHSTDATSQIVQNLMLTNNNIQLIQLAKQLNGEILNSYKKKAIENAITYANGNWIVTTDADCIVQQNWLQNFDAFIQQYNSVFVAAPVAFTNNGSLVQTFQYIDFMSLQGITAASVHAGFHNMCNGANLAYKKDVFFEVNGFRDIDNIASGDDMLLMNKIKQQYNNGVDFLFTQQAIVTTHPMPNWKSFLNQRIRWASKADKLIKTKDSKTFAVLVLVYFLNAALFMQPFLAIFNSSFLWWWFVFLAIKTLFELAFALPVAKFFAQPFIWWFPLLQPLHILYIVVSGWLGKFGTYNWKGRKVK